MSDISAFRQTGSTVPISATTSSQNVAISGSRGSVMVHNQTSSWAYVSFGIGNTLTAASTDYWVAPGSTQPLSVPTNITYAAAILVSGTGTIGFTPGEGA